MIYDTSEKFQKDFKLLCKKFRSLPDDLENLKKSSIELFHAKIVNINSIVPIEGMCNDLFISYKVRKIRCKALKGRGVNSGLRLIYTYEKSSQKITFLELYFKGEKENEDRDRIKDFILKVN